MNQETDQTKNIYQGNEEKEIGKKWMKDNELNNEKKRTEIKIN